MAGWPYCTSKWARLRVAKLAETPLCEICTRRGLTVEAVAVDHFTPIRQGGPAFPELSGLLALCEPCHNEKTAAFDKPGGQPFRRRFRGFDADGNPIDPFDAWHRPEGRGAVQGRETGGQGPVWEAARLLNNEKGK